MTPAELRQLRDELLGEQASLKRKITSIRTALVGIEGLLGETPAAPAPAPRRHHVPVPHPRRRVQESDAAVIAERVSGGEETLEAIALDYHVTRERIRQVAEAAYPGAGKLGRAVRRAYRVERQAVAAEVCGVVTALRAGPCIVCTGPVTRKAHSAPGRGTDHARTCSPRCMRLWSLCRYHLDEDGRTKHAVAAAKWQLAHDPKPFQQRYAERVVAGETTPTNWIARSPTVKAALAEVAELRQAVAASGESWWT